MLELLRPGAPLRQFLAILPVYILQFCYGMNSGYPAITTPQLQMDCAKFDITNEEESWIVSIDNVATPFVALLSGYLQHKLGPKIVLMLACIPYIVGWLLAASAGHFKLVWILYMSRLCVGMGHGLLGTTVYTVEIASKELRASFSIFEAVIRAGGMILVYALGSFMSWDEIAFYAPVVPLLAFLLLFRSPESPVHLVSIGEEAKAEQSLMQINETGFDSLSHVKNISLGLEEQRSRSVDKMNYLKNIEKHPEVYKPFLIILLLSIAQQFSGATILRGYVVKIFGAVFSPRMNQLHDNITSPMCECDCDGGPPLSQYAYYSAILVGAVRLIASLSLTSLLVRFKRRHLYLASAIATVCSLAAFGTTLLFATHLEHWHMEEHALIFDWSSVVFGCILVFCVNLGVQPMANLMTSELFPAEVRALCKGVARSLTCVLIVVSLKIFPLLEQAIFLFGTFYFYGAVVLLLLPVIMKVLPETKDHCLTEIHRIFTPQQSVEDYIEDSSVSENSDTSETKQTDISVQGSLNSNSGEI